jgi:hypothetical protein
VETSVEYFVLEVPKLRPLVVIDNLHVLIGAANPAECRHREARDIGQCQVVQRCGLCTQSQRVHRPSQGAVVKVIGPVNSLKGNNDRGLGTATTCRGDAGG